MELTPDKQEEEGQKVASVEGICYSLTNEYYRSYYIYPQDRVKHIDNATGGYKPNTSSCIGLIIHMKVMVI